MNKIIPIIEFKQGLISQTSCDDQRKIRIHSKQISGSLLVNFYDKNKTTIENSRCTHQ